MKLRRLYRLVILAATGGMVFQTTTGCSSDAMSTLASALSEAIGTLITSEITTYMNQYMGTTS